MMSDGKLWSNCRRFQSNQFNRARCKHCFGPKEAHSESSLNADLMMRKVTCCGYLFVAPVKFDPSCNPPCLRRWQRRWFSLFDDGELSFSLDQHPETVPQGRVDMTNCGSVVLHKALGSHSNCIEIYTSNTRVFVKSDSVDEILKWYGILSVYSSNNTKPLSSSYAEQNSDQDLNLASETVVEVKTRQIPRSSGRRMSDPLSQAKVDVSRNDSFHGTPRSVKNRNKLSLRQTKDEDSVVATGRRSSSDVCIRKEELLEALVAQKSSSRDGDTPKEYQIPRADISTVRTLRKGWLMLRGRSNAEWQKHWVVLGGLSLKLYKDAWAEDSGTGMTEIDLTDCECVYPISVSRNYGVELRCRHARYILSAMTPGIRDSWISAIQQNIHNPSPTSSHLEEKQADENGVTWRIEPKKRIAYVAPESHHRNSNDASSSEAEERLSISERWTDLDSGTMERNSEEEDSEREGDGGRRSRRRSLSPTLRRSPVSRIKDRASRRQRSPVVAHHNDPAVYPRMNSDSRMSERQYPPVSIDHLEQENKELRLRLLEAQVETLRDELDRTQSRLSSAESENFRLRQSTYDSSANEAKMDLDRLRRCLVEAEREVLDRQDEMETIRKKLDSSVSELSGTESLLKTKQKELEEEKEQVVQLTEGYRTRIEELEDRLETLTSELRNRDTELEQANGQLAEARRSLAQYQDIEYEVDSLRQSLKDYSDKELGITELEKRLEAKDGEIKKLTENMGEMEAEKQKDMTRKTLDSYLSVIRERDEMIEELRNNRDWWRQEAEDTQSERTDTVFRLLSEEAELLLTFVASIGNSSQSVEAGRMFHSHLSENVALLSEPDSADILEVLDKVSGRLSSSMTDWCAEKDSVRDAWTCTETLHEKFNASDSLTASESFVSSSVPQFKWDHALSPVHEELGESLSAYLCARIQPVRGEKDLCLEDYARIRSEISSLEIALVGEVANILEHAGNDRMIEFSMWMHNIRNCALILESIRAVIGKLQKNGDEHILDEVSLGAFPLLVNRMRNALVQRMGNLCHHIGSPVPNVAKQLMMQLPAFFSRSDDGPVSSTALLQLELSNVFSRFQSLSSDQDSSPNEEDLTKGRDYVLSLAEEVSEQLEELVAVWTEEGNGAMDESLLFHSAQSYWIQLRSGLGAERANEDSKWNEMETHIFSIVRDISATSNILDPTKQTLVGRIIAIKAVVCRLQEWLKTEIPEKETTVLGFTENSCVFGQASRIAQLLKKSICTVHEDSDQELSEDFLLDDSMQFYQPLTRKLVDRCVTNVLVRVTAAWVAAQYETTSHCDKCEELQRRLARAEEERDEMKRRSITEEIGFERSSANRQLQIEQLKRELTAAENRFERERRQLKEEVNELRRKNEGDENVGEVEELELDMKLMDMQASHSQDLDALKSEVDAVRDELDKEQARRKKVQSDMQEMKNRSDQSLLILERSHSQMVSNLKIMHQQQVTEIREEYEQQLNEEKEATRHAIDALQKAHNAELQRLSEKVHVGDFSAESVERSSGEIDSRQSKMLEQMSKELSELSGAYSTKCLENSQLEEELGELKSSLEKQRRKEKMQIQLHEKEDYSNLNGLTASSSAENLSSPGGQRERRMSQQNRRSESRFHTVHNSSSDAADKENVVPEHVWQDFRTGLSVPVAERRKYFENLAGNLPKA